VDQRSADKKYAKTRHLFLPNTDPGVGNKGNPSQPPAEIEPRADGGALQAASKTYQTVQEYINALNKDEQ
jgi:hypothetical protein